MLAAKQLQFSCGVGEPINVSTIAHATDNDTLHTIAVNPMMIRCPYCGTPLAAWTWVLLASATASCFDTEIGSKWNAPTSETEVGSTCRS